MFRIYYSQLSVNRDFTRSLIAISRSRIICSEDYRPTFFSFIFFYYYRWSYVSGEFIRTFSCTRPVSLNWFRHRFRYEIYYYFVLFVSFVFVFTKWNCYSASFALQCKRRVALVYFWPRWPKKCTTIRKYESYSPVFFYSFF